MWGAFVVAAIALAAAAFMIRFLIALLREGAPPVCFWVVIVRRDPEADESYVDKHDTPECNHSVCWPELLVENQGHAKEVRASGLISLDVRHVSAGLGWRSIRRGVDVLRERRI
jgi:hypothetical protein